MFNTVLKWMSYWYLQYELVTCIYMFEPWERKLLNTIIIATLGLVTYSTYMYLPHYTLSMLSHLNILSKEALDELK